MNQWSQKWLGRVKTRKAILGAFSAAFGGKNLAKEYEANAIAKYTDYVNNQAGLIALEGGNVDASVGIARFLKAGGDLDQALDLFGQPGVAAKAPSHKTHFEMRDGKSMKISSDWINGEWIETGAVPQTVAETNIDIKMPGSGSQTEIAKSFGKSFGALLADEERFFMPIQAESAQLPILINAIQSGQVDTGKLASFALPFKQVFSSFLKPGEAQRLFDDRLGATEWFNAVVDSFIGTKLKMTKGSISEKEMAIFQRMIPSLSLTDEGNIRLLNMMHALNRIALHSYKGAIDYSKWIDTQEGGIGGRTGNQNFIGLKKHQEDERKRAVRFLNYLANAPVNTNGPPIPLQRAEAFLQLRNANQSNVTDKQINEQLDKWGYPRG